MGNSHLLIVLVLGSLTLLGIIQGDDNHNHDDMKQDSHAWGYNMNHGPAHWAEEFPDQCGTDKKRQSPININTRSTTYWELPDINIISGSDTDRKMLLFNNAHTAQVAVEGSVFIDGGGLESEFRIVQFHFHWGSSDTRGSEHTINNQTFPLELHMVSYDSDRYTSLMEAVHGYNSLAVLGTLFEVSDEDNEAFDEIINHLAQVQHPSEEKVPIGWIDLNSLLPLETSQFYRYEGSLTTPPCAESVRWTVFSETQHISANQLAKFRELHEGEHMNKMVNLENNYRPPQPLEGRIIYSSFQGEEDEESGGEGSREEDDIGAASPLLSSLGLTLVTIIANLIG